MIIYIHGFGSDGKSSKVEILRENFTKVISPSLSYVPDLAVDTLKQIIESYKEFEEEVFLIGTSLGGYYSLYLSSYFDIKAIILNPAVNAPNSLKRLVGNYCTNYFDNSKYEWTENHINQLEKYKLKQPPSNNILNIVQTGDELLDYKESVEFCKGCNQLIIKNGNHKFENFEETIPVIKKFFNI